MQISIEQARIYLAACQGASENAAEYNQDAEELFWNLQARKLEIKLKVPLTKRREVLPYGY